MISRRETATRAESGRPGLSSPRDGSRGQSPGTSPGRDKRLAPFTAESSPAIWRPGREMLLLTIGQSPGTFFGTFFEGPPLARATFAWHLLRQSPGTFQGGHLPGPWPRLSGSRQAPGTFHAAPFMRRLACTATAGPAPRLGVSCRAFSGSEGGRSCARPARRLLRSATAPVAPCRPSGRRTSP